MLTIVLSDGRTRDLTPEEVERLGGRAAAIFRAQERGWTLLEQGAPLVATGQPVGTAGPPESIARPVTTKIEGSKDVSPAESSGVAARHRARELMEDYRGSRAVPEALAPVGGQVAAAVRVARDVVAAPTADVLPDTATQHPRTFVPDGSSGPTPIARQALDRTAAAVRGLNELNPLHAATLPPYIREAADRALAETPQAADVAQAGGRAVASGALGAVGGAVSGRLAQTLPGRLSTALGTQAAVGAGEEAVQMLPEIRARLDAGRGLPEAVGETIRETYDPTTASGALAIAGAVGGPMLGAMGHFRPSHITQYQPGVNPIRTTGFADPTTKQFQAAARLGPTDPLRVPGVHGIDDAIQGRGRYEGMDELLFDIMHEGGPGNVAQYHASLPPRSRDIPEQLSPFTRGDTLRRVTQTTGPVHNQLLERRRAALAGPEAAAQAARQRGRDVYREGVEARGRLSAAQDELEGRLLEARGAELEARQLPRASVGDVASLEHQASGLRRALPEEGSPWQQDLILSTNEFGRLPRPLDARRSLGSIADLAREQARAQGPRGPAPE